MNKKYKIFALALMVNCMGCAKKPVEPVIVPAIEIKKNSTHVLGTIGEVEPMYVEGMESSFHARIDTGAMGSSMDAKNIKSFERDGEKWVSFTIINRETGEKQHFEKEVVRTASIKRVEDDEKRFVVEMEIKIGLEKINAHFSITNRDKFEYQMLIGRNVLSGRAVVDPALMNTLEDKK